MPFIVLTTALPIKLRYVYFGVFLKSFRYLRIVMRQFVPRLDLPINYAVRAKLNGPGTRLTGDHYITLSGALLNNLQLTEKALCYGILAFS